MIFECTWHDVDEGLEIGTFDMQLPKPGDCIDGFHVDDVFACMKDETANVYGHY